MIPLPLTISSPSQMPEMPHFLRNPLNRSASNDGDLAPERNEMTEALAQVGRTGPSHRRRATMSGHIPLASLSQDHYSDHHYNSGRQYGYQSPSQLSLSQSSHPLPRYYEDPYYHNRKRGSPASSSDTSSITSDVRHRLASGPGSMVSFQGSVLSTSTNSSLNSSRSGSKGVLPRPSLSNSSSFNTKPTFYTSIPEYPPRHAKSEIGSFTHYNSRGGHPREFDSDHEEETVSMPVLPTSSKSASIVPARVAPPPPGHRGNGSENQRPSEVHRRKKRTDHPKIPEETSRDSLQIKIEMVLSVLSVVNSSSKEQNDADAVKFLLALSRTPDTCAVMRQPGCMNMLIQILHNIRHKGERSHREVRARAAETLRNIIQSTGDTRQGKHELCVLGVLEKIRSHCDTLFEFIASHEGSRRIDPSTLEKIQVDCRELLQPIRKLYKYSSDKEKYRPAILNIGGLQATAEVLIVNFRLIAFQDPYLRQEEKPVCHSSKIITVIISTLINLTYGDVHNKSELCKVPDFLKSLVFHIRQQNESIIASSAQVLRNLSWRATPDIKEALHKSETAMALTSAVKYISDEPTIQYTTSALWNLSAHSLESRRRICSTPHGIYHLVELLSYNSPSGTSAVIENVGGILKNLSVVIMQEEKFRRKFREAGGFAKLAQHLKSKNKTVLANATGTLWNLSARCREDQRLLWTLGCVPLLDVHATSEYRNIGENARGALRNLLAFGQQNGYSSKSDVDGYNLKTQQGLSKSLCYAANYTFGQPSSAQQKHSSESLHSRSSQLLPSRSKSNGSTFSLTQPIRVEQRRYDHQYPPDAELEYPVVAASKSKNKLKLSRIQSAPQASITNEDEDTDEWTSYMPYPDRSERVHSKPYADEPPRHKKKQSKSSRSSGGHPPYSLSQTLSTNSDLQVSMSLSPSQLSNDAISGLTALEAGFDPNTPERTHEVYAELDPLDLEDEADDIDRPIRREEHSSAADLYPSPRTPRQHDLQGSGKVGGTGKLALDGSVIRVIEHGEKR